MGRKPLFDKPMPNRPLRIKLTDKDRAKLDRMAAAAGLSTAAWARAVLLEAAGQKPPRRVP